jgi:hypothetical protein
MSLHTGCSTGSWWVPEPGLTFLLSHGTYYNKTNRTNAVRICKLGRVHDAKNWVTGSSGARWTGMRTNGTFGLSLCMCNAYGNIIIVAISATSYCAP